MMDTSIMILMSTKFQITLPEALYQGLRRIARKEDRSAADVVREAIQKKIEESGKPLPKDSKNPFGALGRLYALNSDETDETISSRIDEIIYDKP